MGALGAMGAISRPLSGNGKEGRAMSGRRRVVTRAALGASEAWGADLVSVLAADVDDVARAVESVRALARECREAETAKKARGPS